MELVEKMKEDFVVECPWRPDIRIPAGITYFGQFIDHDLTRTPQPGTYPQDAGVEGTPNLHSPALDLDVLYGRGPEHPQDRQLYDGVRLRVGDPVQSPWNPHAKPRSFDLPLGPNRRPLAADTRSNQTVIMRQLTAVFARLHNAAVEQLERAGLPDLELFRRAKQQTIWQYQWLVVGDFLARILDPSVYDAVFRKRRAQVEWQVFSTPIEFAGAAFRYGHSMVRENYLLSSVKEATLSDLLKRSEEECALQPEWQIDWSHFFQGAGSTSATTAMPIDTKIAPTMHALPPGASKFFALDIVLEPKATNFNLPFETLKRGVLFGLPSGQEASAAFGYPVLSKRELTCDCRERLTPQGAVLLKYGLTDNTPLWFYLLKESEVRHNGNHLGPTGSRIVAETMFGALMHDPESFVNQRDPAARPPEWIFTGSKQRFASFGSLFAAVNGYL